MGGSHEGLAAPTAAAALLLRVLLRVTEHLQSGIVPWARVNMPPRVDKSIYLRVENCNLAVELARKLSLSVVGIGGKDIADGTPKLTLAIVWQLMRKDVLRFLAELDMKDADVLTWANHKVFTAEGPGEPLISGFGDPTIRFGVYVCSSLINFSLKKEGTPFKPSLSSAV